jgi:rod shape-determining protein MreB
MMQRQRRITRLHALWQQYTAAPRLDLALALGSSKICVVTGSKITTFPAMLALDARSRLVAIGAAASGLEGREPEGVRLVRPFHGGALTDFLAGRQLLQHGFKKVRLPLASAPRVALAAPSQMSSLERETWDALTRAAGARETYFCSQLVLAAAGAGKAVLEPRARFVLTIGAGSMEMGVVALGGCLMSRRYPGGGDLLTDLISDYVRRKHHLLIHRGDAEAVKRALVTDWEHPAQGNHTLVGKLVDLGQPGQVYVETRELVELLQPVVEEWVGHVKQTLVETSVEWQVDLAREGLLLTGGGCAISGFAQLLERRLELPTELAEAPEKCVAQGLRKLVTDGGLRRALLSDAPSTFGPGDYRRRQEVTGRRWMVSTAVTAALLTGCFFASLHSLGPRPELMSIVSAMNQAEAGQRPPEATWTAVAQTEKNREIEELASENARLLSLLKRSPISNYEAVLARVVGRDPQGWLSSWTLDAGTDQGLRPGQVVVSASGLVGRVVEAGPTTSRMRPLLDADSIVAGRIRGRSAGAHTGDGRGFSGVVLGRGQSTLEMRYLDADAGIKKGDRVFTNGQDGRFPAGILLGTVVQTQRQLENSSLTAVVAPAAHFNDLDEVLVLRRFELARRPMPRSLAMSHGSETP